MGAHFEQGDRGACGCGASWVAHCMNKACHWLRCSRKGCSGLFDLRHRRFWIRKDHLPKAS